MNIYYYAYLVYAEVSIIYIMLYVYILFPFKYHHKAMKYVLLQSPYENKSLEC